MRFQRHIKLEEGLKSIHLVPFLNIFFLLLTFFVVTTSLTLPSSIDVKLPKAVTSDVLKEKNLIITVTSENIVYLNGKLVTLKELKKNLQAAAHPRLSILIKADRRASVGRIVDVWDVCRHLGIEDIHMATN